MTPLWTSFQIQDWLATYLATLGRYSAAESVALAQQLTRIYRPGREAWHVTEGRLRADPGQPRVYVVGRLGEVAGPYQYPTREKAEDVKAALIALDAAIHT
jgi:hypothetical protein